MTSIVNSLLKKKKSPKHKTIKLLFLTLLAGFMMINASAQVTTNSSSGLAATYGSLSDAITALNAATISAPVTIELTASNPQTAPAGGYSITATGTVTNTITITGNGNTITAPSQTTGSLSDAIFKIVGGDYITIQGFTMQERSFTPVSADVTEGTNTMTEFGVALFYATTTNGAQNCTIQNNTITLNRAYQNTFGIYSNSTHSATNMILLANAPSTAGNNSGLKVYSNTISNINHGLAIIGPLQAAYYNTGIDIGGTASGTGNTISNFGTNGTYSAFYNVPNSNLNGIVVKNSTGFNVSYNSITSSNGGITAQTTLRGIFINSPNNDATGTFTNNINNNTIALTHGFTSGIIYGIAVENKNGTATSTLNINNNNFTALGSTVATSGAIYAIYMVTSNLINNINENTFTNITANTSNNFVFIHYSNNMPAGGSQTINGNSIVTGFSKTGAGNSVILAHCGGSSPNGTFHTFTNNNFSNITVTGATGITGASNTDGSSIASATRTVTGNTFNNWTGGTNAINVINYNHIGGTTSTISNNIITNITGQGSISGIVIGSSASLATTLNVANNTINNLSSTGTGGQVIGISSANVTTTININNNAIHTLSSTGASSSVSGILISAAATTNIFSNTIYGIASSSITSPLVLGISVQGGTTVNTYQNKIYSLSASGAISTTSPAVVGIGVTAGTNVNTHNNLIGNLTAPAASLTDAIRGINIASTASTSNQRVYHNTINLNANSSGANFGSTGLYHTYNATGTTAALDMRNNIIVNSSVAKGTGLAVAFRRSAATDLANYAITSNNNLFFGTSGVYNDGAATYAFGPFQTLVSTRETASRNQNPSFASTTGSDANFLNFANGAFNLAGGNAQVLASPYNTDYAGVTRDGSIPDIGAFEFTQGILTTWDGSTWSNGAPTSISDVFIASSTAPASFTCKDLTINSTFALTTTGIAATVHGNIINNGNGIAGTGDINLVANSVLSGNTINFTGTLTLNGSAAQTLNANGASIKNLIINNAAGVSLTGALNLIGVLTPTAGVLTTGGFLTLKSSASETASIGAAIGTISGNVTIERYIPGARKFRLMAHPFTTAQNLSVITDDIDITGNTTGVTDNNTSKTVGTGFTAVLLNNPSAFRFSTADANGATSDAGWKAFTAADGSGADNTWGVGKGIRVLIRGTKGQGLESPNVAYTPSALTLDMTGTVNTGNVNISLVTGGSGATAGFNLVGNPYPSPVDISAVVFASTGVADINKTVYTRNPQSGSYTTQLLANGTPYSIPSYAAVFIRNIGSGNVNLPFTEARKTSTSSLTTFKNGLTNIALFEFKIGGVVYDNLNIGFDEKAKAVFETKYDAIKLSNDSFNFSAITSNGEYVCTDFRPFINEGKIKLFTNIKSGSTEIEINATTVDLPAGKDLFFVDQFTNKSIKVDAKFKYTFTIDANNQNTFGSERFYLTTSMGTAVNEMAKESFCSIYPNPTTDILNIALSSSKEGNYTYTVLNQLGQTILSGDLMLANGKPASIKTQDISNGVYFLKISNGNQSQTIQFIK